MEVATVSLWQQQEENPEGFEVASRKTKVSESRLFLPAASLHNYRDGVFFPARALTEPREIKRRLNELNHPASYYNLWNNTEPIPEGVLSFEWNKQTGLISCKQIYATGLLYLSEDVLSVRADESTVNTLTILARLFI